MRDYNVQLIRGLISLLVIVFTTYIGFYFLEWLGVALVGMSGALLTRPDGMSSPLHGRGESDINNAMRQNSNMDKTTWSGREPGIYSEPRKSDLPFNVNILWIIMIGVGLVNFFDFIDTIF